MNFFDVTESKETTPFIQNAFTYLDVLGINFDISTDAISKSISFPIHTKDRDLIISKFDALKQKFTKSLFDYITSKCTPNEMNYLIFKHIYTMKVNIVKKRRSEKVCTDLLLFSSAASSSMQTHDQIAPSQSENVMHLTLKICMRPEIAQCFSNLENQNIRPQTLFCDDENVRAFAKYIIDYYTESGQQFFKNNNITTLALHLVDVGIHDDKYIHEIFTIICRQNSPNTNNLILFDDDDSYTMEFFYIIAQQIEQTIEYLVYEREEKTPWKLKIHTGAEKKIKKRYWNLFGDDLHALYVFKENFMLAEYAWNRGVLSGLCGFRNNPFPEYVMKLKYDDSGDMKSYNQSLAMHDNHMSFTKQYRFMQYFIFQSIETSEKHGDIEIITDDGAERFYYIYCVDKRFECFASLLRTEDVYAKNYQEMNRMSWFNLRNQQLKQKCAIHNVKLMFPNPVEEVYVGPFYIDFDAKKYCAQNAYCKQLFEDVVGWRDAFKKGHLQNHICSCSKDEICCKSAFPSYPVISDTLREDIINKICVVSLREPVQENTSDAQEIVCANEPSTSSDNIDYSDEKIDVEFEYLPASSEILTPMKMHHGAKSAFCPMLELRGVKNLELRIAYHFNKVFLRESIDRFKNRYFAIWCIEHDHLESKIKAHCWGVRLDGQKINRKIEIAFDDRKSDTFFYGTWVLFEKADNVHIEMVIYGTINFIHANNDHEKAMFLPNTCLDNIRSSALQTPILEKHREIQTFIMGASERTFDFDCRFVDSQFFSKYKSREQIKNNVDAPYNKDFLLMVIARKTETHLADDIRKKSRFNLPSLSEFDVNTSILNTDVYYFEIYFFLKSAHDNEQYIRQKMVKKTNTNHCLNFVVPEGARFYVSYIIDEKVDKDIGERNGKNPSLSFFRANRSRIQPVTQIEGVVVQSEEDEVVLANKCSQYISSELSKTFSSEVKEYVALKNSRCFHKMRDETIYLGYMFGKDLKTLNNLDIKISKKK